MADTSESHVLGAKRAGTWESARSMSKSALDVMRMAIGGRCSWWMTTRPYGADHTNIGQPPRQPDLSSRQRLIILMMKPSGASPKEACLLGTDDPRPPPRCPGRLRRDAGR